MAGKSDVESNRNPKEDAPLVLDKQQSGFSEAQNSLATAASLVSLVSIAVLKTQLTAYLFHSSNYPTAYSLWSCVVTCLMLVPFFLLSERRIPPRIAERVGHTHFAKMWSVPTRGMAGVLSLIVFFTAFDLGFTNIALANLSTALQQCIAATNPFWTIMIESAVHGKFQPIVIYLVVLGLVAGAVLASLGSVEKLSLWGICAAVVAVLCSSSKYVFTHKAFSAFKGELGALALLFWVDLFMVPIYLVWTIGNGELVDMFSVAFTDTTTTIAFTFTAALGGVRALTQYVVLVFVTATSMSTANIFTQILNILISIPIQGTLVTPYLGAGIFLVMSCSATYTLFKTNKTALSYCDGRMKRSLGMEPAPPPPPAGSNSYHRGDWPEKTAGDAVSATFRKGERF